MLATRHLTDPKMMHVFIDPDTGEAWKEGQTYTRPILPDTLELLAIAGDNWDELFYKCYIAEELTEDLKLMGGFYPLQICTDTNQSGRSRLEYL